MIGETKHAKCIECEATLPKPYTHYPVWDKSNIKEWKYEGETRCPRCIEANEIRAIGEAFEDIGQALNSWEPGLGATYDNRPDISEAYRQGAAALLRLRAIVNKDMTATILAKANHDLMILADGQEELENDKHD